MQIFAVDAGKNGRLKELNSEGLLVKKNCGDAAGLRFS